MSSDALLAGLILWTAAPALTAAEPSDAWWVWLPSRAEARSLAAGFRPGERIYWHTATMTWTETKTWRDTEFPSPPPPPAETSGAEIIPVLRLHGGAPVIEDAAAWPGVTARFQEMLALHPAAWVQLDCDCPDRLLPRYATRLQALRRALSPVKLSVTALAGQAARMDPAHWKSAADELTPMFYDLAPDLPDELLTGRVHSLADVETCARWMPAWGALGVPWRCGLANFRRLSRFTAEGAALGHFQTWDFAPLLEGNATGIAEPAGAGAWKWRVTSPLRLNGARGAAAGDWLIFREPDLPALLQMEAAALAAGAQGVVWFSRPSGRATDGWSTAHLRHRHAPKPPAATLTRTGQTFTLTAGPDADYAPMTANTPGHVLQLRAGGAVLETSSAGEFAAVTTGPVVSWRFPSLAAGSVLRTAPVHVPPAAGASLRWRVLPRAESEKPDAEHGNTRIFPWRELP